MHKTRNRCLEKRRGTWDPHKRREAATRLRVSEGQHRPPGSRKEPGATQVSAQNPRQGGLVRDDVKERGDLESLSQEEEPEKEDVI